MDLQERRGELIKELESLRANLQTVTISIPQHEGAIAMLNEAIGEEEPEESDG